MASDDRIKELEETFESPHHDVDIDLVDPDLVEVDTENERNIAPGPRTTEGDLERSIRQNGIEDPPQVRYSDSEDFKYKVFAGQRRVLAAQSIPEITEIPIIVKDLTDVEALAASVNENNPHLQKKVHRKDRAKAVKRVVEEWGMDDAAEYFGVSKPAIHSWLEPLNDFWAGTIFDPDIETDLDEEYIANDILSDLRRMFNDSDKAETAAKRIIKQKVPPSVVRSAISTTDDPRRFWDELREQWEAIGKGQERSTISFVLTGEDAENLQSYAKDHGVTIDEVAERFVKRDLRMLFDNDSGDMIIHFKLEEQLANKLRRQVDGRSTVERAVAKAIVKQHLEEFDY